MTFFKTVPLVMILLASGGLGNAEDAPAKEITPAAEEDARNAWVAENGKVFLKTKGTNKWVEYNEGRKPAFTFEGVGSTPERIELRDHGRGLSIHLYAQTSEWGLGDPPPQMVTLYKGHWTDDPPAVPPETVAETLAINEKATAAPSPTESELSELKELEELITTVDARRVQAVCKGRSIPLPWVKNISVEAAAVLADTSKRETVVKKIDQHYTVMVAVPKQIERKVMAEKVEKQPDGTTKIVPYEKSEVITAMTCRQDARVRTIEVKGDKVPQLDLDGLEEITTMVAVALSRHDGDLSLNGLKELDADSAAALSQLAGELRLNGLKQLSDPVAKALSQHEGGLLLHGVKTISRRCFDLLQGKQCFAADIVVEE